MVSLGGSRVKILRSRYVGTIDSFCSEKQDLSWGRGIADGRKNRQQDQILIKQDMQRAAHCAPAWQLCQQGAALCLMASARDTWPAIVALFVASFFIFLSCFAAVEALLQLWRVRRPKARLVACAGEKTAWKQEMKEKQPGRRTDEGSIASMQPPSLHWRSREKERGTQAWRSRSLPNVKEVRHDPNDPHQNMTRRPRSLSLPLVPYDHLPSTSFKPSSTRRVSSASAKVQKASLKPGPKPSNMSAKSIRGVNKLRGAKIKRSVSSGSLFYQHVIHRQCTVTMSEIMLSLWKDETEYQALPLVDDLAFNTVARRPLDTIDEASEVFVAERACNGPASAHHRFPVESS